MSRYTWKEQAPSQEGYYLFSNLADAPEIVRVYLFHNKWRASFEGGAHWDLSDLQGYWKEIDMTPPEEI